MKDSLGIAKIARERVEEFFRGNEEFVLITKIEEVKKMRSRIQVKHLKCGTIFNPTIDRFLNKGTRCPNRECKIVRRKNTHIERYGYDVVFSDKERMKEIGIKCKKRKYSDIFENERYVPLFNFDDYSGVTDKVTGQHFKYLFKCAECGSEFYSFLSCGRNPICRKCFPYSYTAASAEEEEIASFLEKDLQVNVLRNDRIILEGKEIDILIKDKNLGVEYNGLIWHSEKFNKDRRRCAQKTKKCQEAGIKLLHFFSDEWREKSLIIKSMLSYALEKSEKRIGARKCLLVEDFDKQEVETFFNENHISGNSVFLKSFSLLYDGEIVSCLTLRKPFTKRYKNVFEVSRFCNKINYSVPGSFSRLMKLVISFAKRNNIDSILTYSDNRFGDGGVYQKYGFKYCGDTRLDYYYTDGYTRYNRFKFRASGGKSEKQIAMENKVHRIYGCGSKIFILNTKGAYSE